MEQYNYMPIGTVVSYAGVTTPIGWLLCDGRTIEEHEYPDLYRVLGSGILPDLRGEFVRGLDNGRGLDGGRVLGSEQGDAIRNITGSIDVSAYADTAGSNIIVGHQGVFGNLGNTVTGEPVSAISYTGSKPRNRASIDASRQVPTAEENRPKNVALNYIIKAFNTTTDTETLPIQMAKALNNKIENNYNDQLDATVDIVGKEFYDYIQNSGEKTAGKIYRDRLQKGIFRCLKTTTSILNTSEFYEPISNNDFCNKLQNLYNSVTNFDSTSNDGKIRISGVYNEIFKTMILRIYSTSGDFTIDSKGIICTFDINIPNFVNTDFCINDGGPERGNIGSKTGFLNIKYIDNNRIELSVSMAEITTPIYLRGTVTLQLV